MQKRVHRLKTLAGAFESEKIAEAAIQELRAVGFSTSQIGFVSRRRTSDDDMRFESMYRPGIDICWGFTAVVGFAPGIGPTIAGGMLAAIFWSTVTIGAAGALVGIGLSDEDAQHFEERFRAGNTIVTIAGGTRADIASSILNRFHHMNLSLPCET